MRFMFDNTFKHWIVYISLGLGCLPGTHASPGVQEVIGELDRIPMHRISVETRSHALVNVKIDGRVTEAVWQTFLPLTT